MKVRFSQTAKETLVDIYRYIAVENYAPKSAEKLITEIENVTISLLTDNPKLGRKFNGENIRFIVVKNYVILYEIEPEYITVVDIYRAGRNWR